MCFDIMATNLGSNRSLRRSPQVFLLVLLLVPLYVARGGGGALLGASHRNSDGSGSSSSFYVPAAHQQLLVSSSDAAQWCPDAVFNFGSSSSDTGNALSVLSSFDYVGLRPYGETFFGRSTGRFSDGRLIIDFLLLAFKLPLLQPSRLPTGGREVRGLNFAFAGASATDDNPAIPYNANLKAQLDEFVKLKASASYRNDLSNVNYSTALFTLYIGQNDVLSTVYRKLPIQDIFERVVPEVVQAIVDAVDALYLEGARNVLIFNNPPAGCSPKYLFEVETWGLTKDGLGCVKVLNEINQAINSGLSTAIQHLRGVLHGVSISMFDTYAANIEILTNPSKYGFDPQTLFETCCGIVSDDFSQHCGNLNVAACSNVDEHLVWDGTHFTDAFNRVMAQFLLDGQFSDPPTNLTAVCNLSFEDFYGKKYEDIFPETEFSGLSRS